MEVSKNRLQFVHHDEIFATREEAIEYITGIDRGDKFHEDALRPALYGEPMVVRYKNITDEDESGELNPNILLAIGSVGVSDENEGEVTPDIDRRTYFIDFSRHEEEIKEIAANTAKTQEEVYEISGLVINIIEACGLNEDGTYVTYDNSIIVDAVSITDAVNKIADYVIELEKRVRFSVDETLTVKLNLEEDNETGRHLTADVKVPLTHDFDDAHDLVNGIVIVESKDDGDGIFMNVDLEYAGNGEPLKLIVNGEVVKEIDTPLEVHVENGEYDAEREMLVISLSNGEKIEIDLKKLAGELTVDKKSTTPIQLYRNRVKSKEDEDGQVRFHSILSADVKLAQFPHNILEVVNGGETNAALFVKGTSDNIAHKGGTTVEAKLDEIDANLVAEAAQREADDKALDNKINDVKTDLTEFSEKITEDLSKEASIREAADNVINLRIDGVDERVTNLDADLQSEKVEIREIVDKVDKKNTLTVSPLQEANASLVLKVNTTEAGTTIEGWAVADSDGKNIIKGGGKDGSPLRAEVDLEYSTKTNELRFLTSAVDKKSKIITLNNANLEYESSTNVLTFTSNDNKVSKIQLNTGSLIKHIDYNREREVLIIYYDDAQGIERTVEVEVSAFFKEWDVDRSKDGAIELSKTRIKDGTDILSASVILSASKHNMIENINGALIVSDEDLLGTKKALQDEIDRAKDAEKELANDIEGLDTRLTTAEGKLDVITSPDKELEGSIANAIKQSKDYTDQEIKNATLSGSDAIKIDNKVVSLVVNEDEKYLEITGEGLKTVGIDNAIGAAKKEVMDALSQEIQDRTDADADLQSQITDNATAINILNSDKLTEDSVDYKIDQAISDLSATTKQEIKDVTLVGSETIDITDKIVSVNVCDHEHNEYLKVCDKGLYVGGVNEAIAESLKEAKEYTDESVKDLNNGITEALNKEIQDRKDADAALDEKIDSVTLKGSDSIEISSDNEIKVKVNKETDYLVVGAEGLEIIGLKDDIDTAKNEAYNNATAYTANEIDGVNYKLNGLSDRIDANTTLIQETSESDRQYTDDEVAKVTLVGSKTIDITDKVVSVKYNENDKYLTSGIYGLETKDIDSAISNAVKKEADTRQDADDMIIRVVNGHIHESEVFSGQLESEIQESVKKVVLVKHDDNELTYDVVYYLNNGNQFTGGTINVPKDKFIDSVDYDDKTHILTIVFETEDGTKTVTIPLTDLIDVYTAGDGLVLKGSEFSISLVENEKYLKIQDGKLASTQIAEDINTAKQEAKQYTDDEVAKVTLTAGDAIEIDSNNKINVKVCNHLQSTKYLRIDIDDNQLEVFGIDEAIDAASKELEEKISKEISGKIDVDDVYTKIEIDTKLDEKANKSDVYTKDETVSRSEFDQTTTTLISKISENTRAIESLSGNVYSDIERLSGKTFSEIERLSGNVYTSIERLSGNVYTSIERLSGNVYTDIEKLSGNTLSTIEKLSGKTFSEIERLSGNVYSSIEKLSGNVYSSIEKLSGNTFSAIENTTESLTDLVKQTSASTVDIIKETSSTTKEYIDTKITDIEKQISSAISSSTLVGSETIDITDNVVRVKYNVNDKYLTLGSYGLETNGIDKAISDAVDNVSADFTEKTRELSSIITKEIEDRKSDDSVLSGKTTELSGLIKELRTDVNTVSGTANNALDLAKEIKSTYAWIANDTPTVKLTKTESTNSGFTLTADVKLSTTEGNIITADTTGIYAKSSNLTYDTGSNTLTFTNANGEIKPIVLNSVSTINKIDVVERDGVTYLVFFYNDDQEVKINAADFFKGIVGTNDGNVEVTTALTTTQGSTSTGITANLDVNKIIDNTNANVTLTKVSESINKLTANVAVKDLVDNTNVNVTLEDNGDNKLFANVDVDNIITNEYDETPDNFAMVYLRKSDDNKISARVGISTLEDNALEADNNHDLYVKNVSKDLERIIGIDNNCYDLLHYLQNTYYLYGSDTVINALIFLDELMYKTSGDIIDIQEKIDFECLETDSTIMEKGLSEDNHITLKTDVKLSTKEEFQDTGKPINLLRIEDDGLVFDGNIDCGSY